LKNVAYFSSQEFVVFPATLSPQSHHVLPSKTPRYATSFSEKPLQNTTATTPEKKSGMVAKFLARTVLPDGLPAREAVTS